MVTKLCEFVESLLDRDVKISLDISLTRQTDWTVSILHVDGTRLFDEQCPDLDYLAAKAYTALADYMESVHGGY